MNQFSIGVDEALVAAALKAATDGMAEGIFGALPEEAPARAHWFRAAYAAERGEWGTLTRMIEHLAMHCMNPTGAPSLDGVDANIAERGALALDVVSALLTCIQIAEQGSAWLEERGRDGHRIHAIARAAREAYGA